MITTNAERASYLRTVVDYLDGLPLLIAEGTPDQVHLELDRCRATIRAVMKSFDPAQRPRPPLRDCDA
jgi:hypothetical protein